MILVDTSVWIDHLRNNNEILTNQLKLGNVLIHPLIIGELACETMKNRAQILHLFNQLQFCTEASYLETLSFLENNKLMGRGIGFIDIHLLASTALTQNAALWTFDKQLNKASSQLNLNWVDSTSC